MENTAYLRRRYEAARRESEYEHHEFESLESMPRTRQAAEELARFLCYKYSGNPDVSQCVRHLKKPEKEELVSKYRGKTNACLNQLKVSKKEGGFTLDGIRLQKEEVSVGKNGQKADKTSLPPEVIAEIQRLADEHEVDYEFLTSGVRSRQVLPFSGGIFVSVVFSRTRA